MTPKKAFAALGLPDDATTAEVKAAYRDRAQALHPDKGGNAGDFARLNEAYNVALELTSHGLMCPSCAGRGKLTVVHGFDVASSRCGMCKGSGLITREFAATCRSRYEDAPRVGASNEKVRGVSDFNAALARVLVQSLESFLTVNGCDVDTPITAGLLRKWLNVVELKNG